jgi:hypothetical protein
MGAQVNGLRGHEEPKIAREMSLSDRPVAQVRGVLAQEIIISTSLDPFFSLKALATYSGLSLRKLRDHLAEPAHPLPCYRIGGKTLVRRSEFDAWITRYRQVGRVDVDGLVNEVLADLR